jgi:hypothetical protein
MGTIPGKLHRPGGECDAVQVRPVEGGTHLGWRAPGKLRVPREVTRVDDPTALLQITVMPSEAEGPLLIGATEQGFHYASLRGRCSAV